MPFCHYLKKIYITFLSPKNQRQVLKQQRVLAWVNRITVEKKKMSIQGKDLVVLIEAKCKHLVQKACNSLKTKIM